MDKQKTTLEVERRQESPTEIHIARQYAGLTPRDRRLLLGASLRLLVQRFECGQPILKDDVARLASLADVIRARAKQFKPKPPNRTDRTAPSRAT